METRKMVHLSVFDSDLWELVLLTDEQIRLLEWLQTHEWLRDDAQFDIQAQGAAIPAP